MARKTLSIEEMVKQLDTAITNKHDEYAQLHEELNKHRGKPLEETELPEVNRILKEIQLQFSLLYPALNFIGRRYEFAQNSVNAYNEFIETLKKAGAHQEPPAETVEVKPS